MRVSAILASFAVLALAACAPPPYEQQQQSVGFGNYVQYQQQREAALAGQPPAGPGPVNAYDGTAPVAGAPLGAGTIGAVDPNAPPSMTDLTAAGIAAQAAAVPPVAAPAPAPVFAGTTATAAAAAAGADAQAAAEPVAPDNVGISDEQDFSAVASRETIESDKQRIEANKAQYQQIQPGALPERSGEAVSPAVAYAIAAQNKLGQAVYKRSGLSLSSSEKACLRYASSTEAQEAFLKSGGPKRDPKNLDPDGDGFACRWDPTPFQGGAAAVPAPAQPAAAADGNG